MERIDKIEGNKKGVKRRKAKGGVTTLLLFHSQLIHLISDCSKISVARPQERGNRNVQS
jgi:hypothetical protein